MAVAATHDLLSRAAGSMAGFRVYPDDQRVGLGAPVGAVDERVLEGLRREDHQLELSMIIYNVILCCFGEDRSEDDRV